MPEAKDKKDKPSLVGDYTTMQLYYLLRTMIFTLQGYLGKEVPYGDAFEKARAALDDMHRDLDKVYELLPECIKLMEKAE